MDDNRSIYSNPLIERYSSKEMSTVFSHDTKFKTWRRLWIALAESEKELGLNITDEQIQEMKTYADDIDYARAAEIESEVRHDVMAHVHAFAEKCSKAAPVIHLGATSAYVGDNTDIIQIRDAGHILIKKGLSLISALRDFAMAYREMPALGFTHFQPAQCTTVGKRACLWLQDILMDIKELKDFLDNLPLRGVKGTTGTQASYMKLFEGDEEKVKKLDKKVCAKMGFKETLPVTGQTYTRKIDSKITSILSGMAQSLHKMGNDIRLLQHKKEIEEPFGKKQIGSSAMAYKRNPMRSERMTALCRYIISLSSSPAMTASEQWFERTLDDSANKRLVIPESFLAADAVLSIGSNISSGLQVYPEIIKKHLKEELPFMATEDIIMQAAKQGGNRQELHERIRVHSMEAGKRVKQEGMENDLLERIAQDPVFGLTEADLKETMDTSNFTGRAASQTREFIKECVEPFLESAGDFRSPDEIEDLKV